MKILKLFASFFFFIACTGASPPIDEDVDIEFLPKEPLNYLSFYDEFKDAGQYWIPINNNNPKKYWNCTGISGENKNNSISETGLTEGLQYHLLAQSIQGLSFLAVEDGKTDVAVWFDKGIMESYINCKASLGNMGIREIGMQTAVELATKSYSADEDLKKIWTGTDGKPGYVLSDVVNNPESSNVATVAAHVYNAVIVDVRDQAYFNSQGYVMRYDASQKTLEDAWKEFKDKCSNEALVVMPVQTGELRSYAIAHKLFAVNLNKRQGSGQEGQNGDLFEEILAWLKPNAPVLGWEQGVGEDAFVRRVTKAGNRMIPYDWAYNTDFTAMAYKDRQKTRVRVDNPKNYVYDKSKNYTSFYLSDGDNVQWMLNNFNINYYYANQDIASTKMTFGLPVANLSMIAPSWMDRLLEMQNPQSSIFESFGGGYYYVDEFAADKDRMNTLKIAAQTTSDHLRQHNCRILGLFTINCKSTNAKDAYKVYIESNNMLDGVVVIQYSPYAGGDGVIYWFKNSDGYHIPVITTKYSLWNHGMTNGMNQGSPAYIASKINLLEKNSFSVVCVHAWSQFTDIGNSNDPVGENVPGGNVIGVAAAKNCVKRINSNTRVVNLQELIWQLRMQFYPEETRQFLNRIID